MTSAGLDAGLALPTRVNSGETRAARDPGDVYAEW